jgi:hypothetical protein
MVITGIVDEIASSPPPSAGIPVVAATQRPSFGKMILDQGSNLVPPAGFGTELCPRRWTFVDQGRRSGARRHAGSSELIRDLAPCTMARVIGLAVVVIAGGEPEGSCPQRICSRTGAQRRVEVPYLEQFDPDWDCRGAAFAPWRRW